VQERKLKNTNAYYTYVFSIFLNQCMRFCKNVIGKLILEEVIQFVLCCIKNTDMHVNELRRRRSRNH